MSEKVLENGNFNYSEWLVSDSYPEIAKRMTLSDSEKEIIKLQVESLEQPLRNRFGKVRIVSGKRSPELNSKIKGEENSDHLTCNATDTIYLEVKDQLEVFKYIVKSNLPYRQVIFYPEANTPFIHKSINIPGKPYKHEAFIKRGSSYIPYTGV